MTLKQVLYILALMLIQLPTYCQSKQGFIDYDKVVLVLPDYETSQKQLEKKSSQLQDSLNLKVSEYQGFLLHGMPHNVNLDTTELTELERTIRTLENRIEDYKEYAIAELTKEEKIIETAFKEKIVNELNQYCSDNNIVCIGDKEAILYCKECIDFTDGFAEYLKRKNRKD